MVGRTVSHYQITEKLGQGGMGVVYKATDTRLDRTVALKFLPPHSLPTDADKQRFHREAKAAASLNHSNICTIHEIDKTDDGQAFIAMEYVEGETLSERIKRGPLKLQEAITIATQVAEGLQAAHEQGIVHRDVKASNVMLTERGGVKVMDFGLAKTEAATMLTQEGTALGTVSYMSPEQARGQEVDHRTDLWSLGVVLYEMISGRLPFAGDYEQAVVYSIMNEDPEALTGLRTGVPMALERVVGKLLAKDRALRYQHADELPADLKSIDLSAVAPSTIQTGIAPAKQTVKRLPALARTAVLLLAGALIGLGLGRLLFRSPPPAPDVRLQQLTANPVDNMVSGASISPDGNLFAYTDTTGIHLRILETGVTRLVPETEGRHFWEVSWFPDGLSLLATGPSEDGAKLSLYAVSILGGTPRKLRDDAWRGTVSPDGSRIVFLGSMTPSREVWVMDANGSNAQRLESGNEKTFWQAAWSPDGQQALYGVFEQGREGSETYIESYDLNSNETSIVLADGRLWQNWRAVLPFAWTPDDHLIVALKEPAPNTDYSNIWKFTMDPHRRRVTGSPSRITNLVGINPRDFRLSADGKRFTFLQQRNQPDIYVATLAAGGTAFEHVEQMTFDQRVDFPGGWSADSQTLFFQSSRGGNMDIYKQTIGQTTVQPLVQSTASETRPQVSPDGSWLLYFDETANELRRVPIEGGPPETVLALKGSTLLRCPARTGHSCVLSQVESDEVIFYALDPVEGKGHELARTRKETSFHEAWDLSPDATHAALVNMTNRIQVIPLNGEAQAELVVDRWWGIEYIAWAADGKGLFINGFSPRGPTWPRGALLYVSLEGTVHVLYDKPNEWDVLPYASPDGRYLAFGGMIFDSHAWMIEDF